MTRCRAQIIDVDMEPKTVVASLANQYSLSFNLSALCCSELLLSK